MRRRIVGVALLLVLALAGCGGDEGSGGGVPSSVVPGDAVFYAEAEIDPSGDQEEAFRSIIEKFPGEGEPQDRITKLIDQAIRESDEDVDYSEDIEPWLGDRVGGFAGNIGPNSADAAVIVATDDEDKAREFVEDNTEGDETEHEGVTIRKDGDAYVAVVDGFLVLGNRPGVEAAIDASKDNPLEEAGRYEDAVGELPEERLATVFIDGAKLAELTGPSGVLSFPREPVAMSIDVEPDAVVAEAVLSSETSAALTGFFTPSSPLLEEVPGGSWYASAQPDFGQSLRAMLGASGGIGGGGGAAEQIERATGLDVERDLASWMGDVAFWVRGTSLDELTAAVVIEAEDEAGARRGLNALGEALPKFDAGLGARPRPDGFSLEVPNVPEPFQAVVRDGRAVIGYGADSVDAALDPGEPLTESPRLQDARTKLGDGYSVGTFLDAAPVLALVESFGLASNPEWQEAKPYIEPFDYVVWGDRKEGDELRARTRIQFK